MDDEIRDDGLSMRDDDLDEKKKGVAGEDLDLDGDDEVASLDEIDEEEEAADTEEDEM